MSVEYDLKNKVFTAYSQSPSAKGETGDKGATGDKGPTGKTGPSDYLVGERNLLNNYFRITTPHQLVLSDTVAKIGDPYTSDDINDITLVTGEYLVIYRGEARFLSDNAYLEAKLVYNGSDISDSVKHIGMTDYATTTVAGYRIGYVPFQLQGRVNVTDLSHIIGVSMLDVAFDAGFVDSFIEVYRGVLEMIRVPNG